MTDRAYAVLIADTDAAVRRDISSELSAMGLTVFEAADGQSALRTVEENDIRVVVCELYFKTERERDLITAIRGNRTLRDTRTVVHTRFKTSTDRDWARDAGADAYLIRPVLSGRLRDVVARVATLRRPRVAGVAGNGSNGKTPSRKSLDLALQQIESGTDRETKSIIVGHAWWTGLTSAEQSPYRKRAKKLGARLLSNTRLTGDAVEVRARRSIKRGNAQS